MFFRRFLLRNQPVVLTAVYASKNETVYFLNNNLAAAGGYLLQYIRQTAFRKSGGQHGVSPFARTAHDAVAGGTRQCECSATVGTEEFAGACHCKTAVPVLFCLLMSSCSVMSFF